jgi:hypothetical protein
MTSNVIDNTISAVLFILTVIIFGGVAKKYKKE